MFFKETIPETTKIQFKTIAIFGALIMATSLVLSWIPAVSSKIQTFSTSIAVILLFVILVFFIFYMIDRSKKERKEYKTWMNNIMENSPLSIILTDGHGIIQYVNPKFTAESGYTLSECVGKNPRIFKSGLQDAEFYKDLWKTIKEGKIWNGELVNYKKNGELYWSEMYIVPIINDQNKVINFIASKKDITKEKKLYDEILHSNHMLNIATKKLQEREQHLKKANKSLTELIEAEAANLIEKEKLLMQQSKMAAMGEMIGMIAHQWRQPLNAISAATIKVNMLNEIGTLSTEELTKTFKFIQDMSQKMSATINDFMDFSKPDREKESIYVMDILNNVLKIIDAQLTTRNITLQIDMQENIRLHTYRKELAHILLNLLSNARDAFENKDIPDKIITIRIYSQEEDVILEIADNAGGINPAIMEKIFEPFFTTKPSGKGTGLGLYMSKKMLQEHFDGSIIVKNTSSGAEFTIMLPNKAIAGH